MVKPVETTSASTGRPGDRVDRPGIAASCSLTISCPSARETVRILAGRPDVAFGIHLTLVVDFADHRWEPLTGGRCLLGSSGRMYMPEAPEALLASARIEEVAAEYPAQIEVALEAGLSPTQLV